MRRIRNRKVIIIFILALGLAGNLYSQDKSKPSIELSFEDVTRLVLENSLDIQIAKYDVYISRTSLDDARSIFDTIFSAEASYVHNKKAQNSNLAASDTKELAFSLGLEKKLSTGTTIALDATTTKTRTNSTNSILDPYNEALAGISLTQELGKNFFGLADRADIKLTKLDIENSEFTSLDDIEEVLYKSQKSYWNLVLKKEEFTIAEDMFKTAKRLYDIYQDKYGLGLVEKSELLAIEALIRIRESDVYAATLNLETAKNDLLFLLNRGDFSDQVNPKDNLACLVTTVDLYQALKESTFTRRDYKRMKNELEKNKIELVVKKNALWPQIDLEASIIRNNLDSQRSGAWEGLNGNSNDQISFKLTFEVPLENREAKAELEKVRLGKSQLLLQFKRVERLILQEINDKVNQVNTTENKVKLYQTIVRLHQEKLDNQIKRLGYGRSNVDTLIQYEEDLLKARLSLASNLYTYRMSLSELELTKNTLLDKYWQEPL